MPRTTTLLSTLAGLLLILTLALSGGAVSGSAPLPGQAAGTQGPPSRSFPAVVPLEAGVQTATTRRVNAPHFSSSVWLSESAVFWLGRVTLTENYADVRVGYNDDHLRVHLAAFDRRLWYDTSPSPGDLTAWDAAELYLDLDGNAGTTPDANTFRFVGQLNGWESRDAYQAVYQGDGSGWVSITLPFTTATGWRGNGLNNNNNGDDRGWVMSWYIPFDSLGLSGPPAQGTAWGIALTLHDRDDAGGTPIADKTWPEAMDSQQPATWGQLAFGLPTYTPPSAVAAGQTMIRHNLNGASVVDADVGGGSNCGQAVDPDFFDEWGDSNYAGEGDLNVQNQGDVADWPCFSKYYVTFPLDAIPPGKVILSATLALHQFGNAGYEPGDALRSLVQVFTVAEDWDEATLTWNNAPLAEENVSRAWVYPLSSFPGWPGVPREWDVSLAVAEAYASGSPLRLAMYSADYAYHSGKYFVSSDTGDWNAEGRPTLTVVWGGAVADLSKTAAPSFGHQGEAVTYTLSFPGSGGALTFTDTLPSGLSAPGDFLLEGTAVEPTYDGSAHRLTWSDAPELGREVTIRYVATITAGGRRTLLNQAVLSEEGGGSSAASAVVVANPHLTYLPLILRNQ